MLNLNVPNILINILIASAFFIAAIIKGFYFSKGVPNSTKPMVVLIISFAPLFWAVFIGENAFLKFICALFNFAALLVFAATLSAERSLYLKNKKLKGEL